MSHFMINNAAETNKECQENQSVKMEFSHSKKIAEVTEEKE